ncbi:flagellar hook-associated protein FlgK [Neptuniibacter halophilus]|uniref:flagellar hook-associated protein FlgK n=1 Tax=Neptuniibacter halophilus TaxID=651666 RepID=UPI002573214F|nr:flagellar hook-associated protein FlgK [Neptuniibacter halophilus]
MSYGLLNLGVQSLQSNQTALGVTGQNISNVNTEGYTRQRPIFQSREGIAGVQIDEIDRVADAFLNRQIWADSATYNSYYEFEGFANELDNLMASDVTSVSKAMDDYFGALQTAVDDPVSLPNRELFIAQSEALVQRFNDLDANIRRQNDTINGRLESNLQTINAIAGHIAELNHEISIAQASGNVNSELLDHRDAKLEELSGYIGFTTLDQPSGEVSVFIGNGEPLVVGLSANSLTTILSPADSSQLNIGIQSGNTVADITNQVSGGKVGGILDYREDVLGSTLDELGRIALVFADTMNEQHQKGMDLNGMMGGLMFTDINSTQAASDRVLAERDNAIQVSSRIYIDDVAALEASEYSLDFNNNGGFTLTREQDGERWTNGSLTAVAAATDVDEDGEFYFDSINGDLTLRVDGFTLTMSASGAFGAGDSFILRPTRNAASEIDSVLTEASQLALAAPLATSADSANIGTGSVSVTITDKDFMDRAQVTGEMTPPFDISFLSPLEIVPAVGNTGVADNLTVTDEAVFSTVTYPLTITEDGAGNFDVSDSSTPANTVTGVALAGGQLDLSASFGITLDISGVAAGSGESFTIQHDSSTDVGFYQFVDADGDRMAGEYVPGSTITLQGFDVTINNSPDINDRFSITLNEGGVSDNRNALLLSDLQFTKTVEGASYQDKYGQNVERVGTRASVAQVNAQAGKSVLDANREMRSSIAGVNLDEEAAKLVQYQQAYQASAQLIRAAQTIFDSLLQSV